MPSPRSPFSNSPDIPPHLSNAPDIPPRRLERARYPASPLERTRYPASSSRTHQISRLTVSIAPDIPPHRLELTRYAASPSRSHQICRLTVSIAPDIPPHRLDRTRYAASPPSAGAHSPLSTTCPGHSQVTRNELLISLLRSSRGTGYSFSRRAFVPVLLILICCQA
jgi:hypothetical protein